MQTDLQKEFGDRLVTLSNNQTGLRCPLTVEAKAPSDADGQPIIEFTASDATLDRYQEVIDPKGWKLTNYVRNPVFQNSHKYTDIIFTIGKGLITEVRGDKLFQRVLFAVDVNPFSKIAYGLYKGGFLNAVSVGFIPIKWENGNNEAGYRRKFLEQELLENSSVSVPANPNALQLGVKSGAIEKADLRELHDLLKHFSKETASSTTAAGVPGGGTDGTQELLRLAREVQQIVRRN